MVVVVVAVVVVVIVVVVVVVVVVRYPETVDMVGPRFFSDVGEIPCRAFIPGTR